MGTAVSSDQWLWEGPDKEPIFGRSWRVENPRGVVIVLHGLGEHSGRYEAFANYLGQFSWQVAALDLPGHGNTPGRAGHVRSWDILLSTVETFIQKQRIRDLPVYIFGHSMGAAIALQVALAGRLSLQGVIASAPPVRLAQPVPRWKPVLARMLKPVFPYLRLDNGIDPKLISRDPGVVKAYLNDPLTCSKVSPGLGLGLLEVGPWLEQHAAQLNIPLLLMHGGADRIADISGSRAFCEAAGDWCHWVEWPEYYHELHHEPGWRQVAATIAGWLDEQSEQRPIAAATN